MSFIVSSVHIYPIKSCRGIDLEHSSIDSRGLKHDRSWLIIGNDGTAITQRDVPQLAMVKTRVVDEQTIALSFDGQQDLTLRRDKSGARTKANVWGDEIDAIDQGRDAAAWFSKITEIPSRLVIMADEFVRPVNQKKVEGDFRVGFADSHPLLIISKASLEELNTRLSSPVPMNRFRPNVVVDGCEAFAEDDWKQIRIGQILFDLTKPCARCVMVTIDQESAQGNVEPLKTLATYRSVGNKVMFGQNMVHHAEGRIAVGDKVEVISKA